MKQSDDNTSHFRLGLITHCLYSFFVFSGISFVMVYLPLVLREAGYSPKEIGFLLSCYNFVGLVAILSFGRLLDVFRCYRILIVGGLLVGALAFSRLFFWQSLHWSLFAIVVLAVSFMPQASLLESYTASRYATLPQYYGRIRSLGSGGYIFFLGLSALANFFDPYVPHRLQVWVFSLFGLVAFLFWLSSQISWPYKRVSAAANITSQAHGKAPKGQMRPSTRTNKFTGIQQLGWPLLIVLLLVTICWAMTMGVNHNFLALFLREELQVQEVSLFFIVATASEIPIIFWGARILHRNSPGLLLLLAVGAALLRLLLYALLPFAWVVLVGQLLHSMAYGLFHISMIAIINRYFTKYRNTAIAIYASTPMLVNSVGAVVGGVLIEEYGFRVFFWTFLLLVLPVCVPVYLLRRRFFRL